MDENEEDFINNETNNSILTDKDKNKYNVNIVYTYDLSDNSFKPENQNENELKQLNDEQNNYIVKQIIKINTSLKTLTTYIPFCFLSFRLSIYLFFIVAVIIFGYLSIMFCALCLFNPIILIMIIWFMFINGVAVFKFVHNQFKEKIKLKKLQLIFEYENIHKAKNLKIVWSYGRDGTWIEVKAMNKNKEI